jgi:hypothetical protein
MLCVSYVDYEMYAMRQSGVPVVHSTTDRPSRSGKLPTSGDYLLLRGKCCIYVTDHKNLVHIFDSLKVDLSATVDPVYR